MNDSTNAGESSRAEEPPQHPQTPAESAPQQPTEAAQPDAADSQQHSATQSQPYWTPFTHRGADPTQTFPTQSFPQPSSPGTGGKGPGKLLVGVAVLALVVGGGAGAVGGYLAGSHSSPVINALDQSSASAQPASNAPAGSVTEVANKVLPAVVQIRTQQDEGSGMVISSDGFILTNNHVVASAAGGGQLQVVFQDGKTTTATIVGRDPTTDVAVIKAQNVSGLPTAQLGSSSNLQIGQQVVAVGSPLGLSGTVTSGIVSSLHRPVNVGDESQTPQAPRGQSNSGQVSQSTVLDAIQTDAAINPGNSGGPLVNMQGQVIGINTAIAGQSAPGQSSVGIGFSIPIDQARRTAQQIEQTGKATQASLGVTVTNTSSSASVSGAAIKDVVSGGAADKAGLKSGDVVTRLNDRTITSADALVAAVHAQAPGDKVTIKLSDGKTVQVTLDGKQVTASN